jgi:hypothetical protein
MERPVVAPQRERSGVPGARRPASTSPTFETWTGSTDCTAGRSYDAKSSEESQSVKRPIAKLGRSVDMAAAPD